jgi:large subunit ribosomal protein L16
MQNGPKKSKFTKIKKGRLAKFEFKSNILKFGTVGLKALQSGTLNSKQIESARQVIAKKTKRKFKIWIKIFTYLPISAKPIGIRMGKGKGKISHWGARIRGGNIIFELCGQSKKKLIASLTACQSKLPIKTAICYKNSFWLTKTKISLSCYDKNRVAKSQKNL